MFGFGRKRSAADKDVAATFVEATGGGWDDIPEQVAGDGGEHADYVGEVLESASDYALSNGIEIGDDFTFTLTNIPRGITSPHEIIFGIMVRASDYGLSVDYVSDETAHFTRVN